MNRSQANLIRHARACARTAKKLRAELLALANVADGQALGEGDAASALVLALAEASVSGFAIPDASPGKAVDAYLKLHGLGPASLRFVTSLRFEKVFALAISGELANVIRMREHESQRETFRRGKRRARLESAS